jgi:hypothetical protein
MKECFSCGGGNLSQKLDNDIKNFGFSVIGTTTETSDGSNTTLCYSIGFTETLDQPEIVTFGLDPKIAHVFINQIYNAQKNGEVFEPGVEYDQFAQGYPSKFKPVPSRNYHTHLIQASHRYLEKKLPFKAMYFVHPDPEGKWPEESDHPMYKELYKLMN